jgi:hypothetical protein
MHDMLLPNGVVITNTISSITGERGKFFRAEYYTYKSVFPYVVVLPVVISGDKEVLQNIIIIASKKELRLKTDRQEFRKYFSNRWTGEIAQDVPILIDDYAPVEYYATKNF